MADEVLADLGVNWEQASQRIVAASGEYGNKRNILENAPAWDRRYMDLKSVINEVSKMLDAKNVHWTIRVGSRIGRERPVGQLADFLGEDVINAFWRR